jgi:CheY-like chemotaxis protein
MEACQLAGIEQTEFVDDGRSARDYLLRQLNGKGREKDLPLVIFVDLNMPQMAAPEFLEWLRAHALLKHIPVFMLTASENPADMQLAQELGTTAYFVKPLDVNELVELLRVTRDFWVKFNRLSEVPVSA